MAASNQPGALTRATSHEQMPAAVAVAVAIKGEADRVTREPSKGPLVTAPENSIQPIYGRALYGRAIYGRALYGRAIQGRRPDRGRRVHRRHRRDGGRGHLAGRAGTARRTRRGPRA